MSKTPITIIDDVMGSGKTSWAIQEINSNSDKLYLFITPYLPEVGRVCDNTSCVSPFYNKKLKKFNAGNKLNEIKYLLMEEKNIATTHSLLSLFDDEVIEMIKNIGYTLILDEVFNVIEQFKISKADLQLLAKANYFTVEPDNRIKWVAGTEDEFSSRTLNEFRTKSMANTLYKYDDTIYYYKFNPIIFNSFKEVFNLTYMFDGQLQKAYYDMHNFKYVYKSVDYIEDKFVLVDFKGYRGSKFKQLINIYDGSLNNIGDKKYSLSYSWYSQSKNKANVETVRKNNYNWTRNVVNANSEDYFWTCYKKDLDKLKRGIATSHLSYNIRATNEHRKKHNVSYLINRYLNPNEKKIIERYGLNINTDLLALSELLQFLYRSAIRENEVINLYIPSKRMRDLLICWLNDEMEI